MCKNRNSAKIFVGKIKGHQKKVKVDECMRHLIYLFNINKRYETLGCCCGHFIYPITIVVRDKYSDNIIEFISGKVIPRTKRFYKRDKQGYYYIPEVVKAQEKKK